MLSLKGKNILVTGGAGFVGSHLVDRLVAEKVNKIIVVDNFFLGKKENLKEAKMNFKNLIILKRNAEDYDFMRPIIKKNRINVVFNLATKCLPYSFINPEEAFMVNVRIADTLLKLLRKKYYQTLIHFSSSEVYGSAKTKNIKEIRAIFKESGKLGKAKRNRLLYPRLIFLNLFRKLIGKIEKLK